MPEVKLPDVAFGFDTVVYVIAVVVAVSGILVAIVKGIEAWKKISVRDRVRNLEGRMERVEARLSLGDKRFELQSDDMGHLLSSQLALMIHLKSGNDHDKLDNQIDSLTQYMSLRATKAAAYAAEHSKMTNGGKNG